MPRLGDLERAVMNVLWAAKGPLHGQGDRRRARRRPRRLAVTTVLTVLSRLERKGVVVRDATAARTPTAPRPRREDHMADLMREALGTASDPDAALARFVCAASPRRRRRCAGRCGTLSRS